MHVEYLKKQIIFSSLLSICSLYFFCFLVLIHSSISFLSLSFSITFYFFLLYFFYSFSFLCLWPFSSFLYLPIYISHSLHLFHHISILNLYSLCSFSSFSASLLCCLLWLLFSFFPFSFYIHSALSLPHFFTVFLTALLLTLFICFLISSSI